MTWLQSNATLGNALILLAAVSAIANAVRALVPANSQAAKVADKMLALSIDLHKLLGSGQAQEYGVKVAKGLVLVFGVALLATPARAQSLPNRSLGGCAGPKNWFCAGPTLSITLTQLDLKDLTPSGTFEPGLGYGVTLFSDQWYTLGLGLAYSLTTPPQGPATFAPSVVLSFAEYLRVGLLWSKTTGQAPERALLIGMGFELGGGTPQTNALLQAIKPG